MLQRVNIFVKNVQYHTIDIARLVHNKAKKAHNENKQEMKKKSDWHSLQKTNIEAMESLILYIQCHVIDKKTSSFSV